MAQIRAAEPVRRRWKPLQTLTFSALERQIGSVSCERAFQCPRSQTLENARTAGICGVDGGVYAPGPFSCYTLSVQTIVNIMQFSCIIHPA